MDSFTVFACFAFVGRGGAGSQTVIRRTKNQFHAGVAFQLVLFVVYTFRECVMYARGIGTPITHAEFRALG